MSRILVDKTLYRTFRYTDRHIVWRVLQAWWWYRGIGASGDRPDRAVSAASYRWVPQGNTGTRPNLGGPAERGTGGSGCRPLDRRRAIRPSGQVVWGPLVMIEGAVRTRGERQAEALGSRCVGRPGVMSTRVRTALTSDRGQSLSICSGKPTIQSSNDGTVTIVRPGNGPMTQKCRGESDIREVSQRSADAHGNFVVWGVSSAKPLMSRRRWR